MITTTRPLFSSTGQDLLYHAITYQTLDVSEAILSIKVGSWASQESSVFGEPQRTQLIEVKFETWKPEYLDEAESFVQAHPDWTGLAPQRLGSNHIYCLPVGAWVDPRTRASVQAAQWAIISNIRDQRTVTGGWPVDGKWFHADAKSVSQQLGLVRKADLIAFANGDMHAGFAGSGPGGFLYWKTMDGTFVLMTAHLARAIFDAAEQTTSHVFSVAEHHKAEMLASTDPESYDYSGGWPLIYGEVA